MAIRIPLRDRYGDVVAHAVIDDKDEAVTQHAWYRSAQGYAVRTIGQGKAKRVVLMHRLITDAARGTEVDHLNHDTLDNRRSNLRVTDKSGNMQNRAPSKKRALPRNVYARPWGTYRVAIGGRHLGSFRTVAEANAVAIAWRAEHMPMSADAAAAAVAS